MLPEAYRHEHGLSQTLSNPDQIQGKCMHCLPEQKGVRDSKFLSDASNIAN